MKHIALSSLLVAEAALAAAPKVPSNGPINRALATTPEHVTVSLPKTERAMDGGSILNDLRFSDGRLYRLSLDFPFDVATDRVRHRDIHFTIFTPDAWARREEVAHRSRAERRLLQLLRTLVTSTEDPRQKKNATTLITFLQDRRRGFPMGRRHWDFTPWTLSD